MVNTKIVDPTFVWNPIDPDVMGLNDITSKGDIPTNMTLLGSKVKVSGSGYSFVKQCIHKENTNKRFLQGGHGNNKKEPKYKDSIVYFNLIVSLDVDPAEIIARTSYKWTRMNGQRIQIKELQDVASKTVVSIFKLSTQTSKAVIIATIKKILNEA
jgi:hypothetical protein